MAVYTGEEHFADETAYLRTTSILGFQGRKELLLPLSHRISYIEYVTSGTSSGYWKTPEGIEELAYWSSDIGQDSLKSIETPALMLNGLTDLVTSYSDIKTVECLKNKYESLRNFFESSSPTTQCGNTIRVVVPQSTECWICGGKITGYPGAGEFKKLELTAECEHVFPIAQALCFAGLYESQLYKQIAEKEGLGEAEAYRKGVTYEYQWAHRICNQVKNDVHYIRYEGGQFSISEELIERFLNDLQTSKKYGSGSLLMRFIKQTTGLDGPSWVASRKKAMLDISNLLINYANTSGLTPEQHAKVTLMSMRSYLSTEESCAGAVEVIPNLEVITGTVKDLSVVSMSQPVASSKHFIGVISEETTGMMNRILGQSGRGIISARDRGFISVWLADSTLLLREALEVNFTVGQLNAIRRKTLSYLKKRYGSDLSTNKAAWSDFQVWTPQVIAAAIYSVAVTDGLQFMLSKSPNDIVSRFISSEPLKKGLTGWLDSKITLVERGGVPFREIYAMPLQQDELPDPTWFRMPQFTQGGGSANGNTALPEKFTLLGGTSRRPLYVPRHISRTVRPKRRTLGRRKSHGKKTRKH